MPEPRLRELVAADLEALCALEQAGQMTPWTPRQLEAALADPAIVVLGLDDGRRLIGQAVAARLPFDAELQAILVAPERRGQGFAGRLLEAVVAQARAWHSERLLLEVRAGNAAALALYRRAGLVEDGRRRGYYPAGVGMGREDAVLMSRPL